MLLRNRGCFVSLFGGHRTKNAKCKLSLNLLLRSVRYGKVIYFHKVVIDEKIEGESGRGEKELEC